MRAQILQAFQAKGLELFGVLPPGPEPSYDHFQDWLSQGKAAGMTFMHRYTHIRADPRAHLPGARSVFVFGFSYRHRHHNPHDTGQVAQYACFQDYHRFLERLASEAMAPLHSPDLGQTYRICIDSKPLLEKPLAARTEWGFIGKNTLYIHPHLGSFYLLGFVWSTLKVPTDEKLPATGGRDKVLGGCGSCKRCEVHCPTQALSHYSLDARRCLSYYTIEHKGPIPYIFWPYVAQWIFGCDICQNVCPYNRHAPLQTQVTYLKLKTVPPLESIATMSQAFYEDTFGGTPMVRAKKVGLQRNALIALIVTHSPKLPQVKRHLRRQDLHPILRATLAQAKYLKGVEKPE